MFLFCSKLVFSIWNFLGDAVSTDSWAIDVMDSFLETFWESIFFKDFLPQKDETHCGLNMEEIVVGSTPNIFKELGICNGAMTIPNPMEVIDHDIIWAGFVTRFLFVLPSWDPEPCHLFQNSLSIFQPPSPEFLVARMEQNAWQQMVRHQSSNTKRKTWSNRNWTLKKNIKYR